MIHKQIKLRLCIIGFSNDMPWSLPIMIFFNHSILFSYSNLLRVSTKPTWLALRFLPIRLVCIFCFFLPLCFGLGFNCHICRESRPCVLLSLVCFRFTSTDVGIPGGGVEGAKGITYSLLLKIWEIVPLCRLWWVEFFSWNACFIHDIRISNALLVYGNFPQPSSSPPQMPPFLFEKLLLSMFRNNCFLKETYLQATKRFWILQRLRNLNYYVMTISKTRNLFKSIRSIEDDMNSSLYMSKYCWAFHLKLWTSECLWFDMRN